LRFGDLFDGDSMMPASNRLRVALTAFDHGKAMCAALEGLGRTGIDVAQVGIAARQSVFSTLEADYHAGKLMANGVPQLLSGAAVLGLAVGHDAVQVSKGSLWPALQCFGAHAGDPPVSAPWMTAQMRDDLTAHLARGAILFGVGARSAGQQSSATQILLEHSSQRVLTHDFRV
jgi:hypothetical protein